VVKAKKVWKKKPSSKKNQFFGGFSSKKRN